jgi:general secretion pathway protein C
MSTFFKKYIWALNLTCIAALAWLTAGAVNDYVRSLLFAVPMPMLAASSTERSVETATKGRVAVDEDAMVNLVKRKVFDLNPREDELLLSLDGDQLASAGLEDDNTTTTAEGELEESSLPINLLGTLASSDPESSVATMTVEGENKIGWVGSEFMDGKAKIVAITPRHIVLQEGTILTVINLWDAAAKSGTQRSSRGSGNKGRSSGKSAAASAKAKSASAARTRSGRKNYSTSVKKTGAYDYEIDRSMLDEELQDLSKLGSQARVVPNYRNGKYEGFKLVGVRPGSLYRAIGIRSGDVIKSVNGTAIDSPNKALDLFDQFKSSSNLNVDIERRGQPKTLNYSIQ